MMYNAELTSPMNDAKKETDGNGVALTDGLDMVNAQTGISSGADFENNTWTFEMPNGFKAGAGKYMIVKVVFNAKLTSPQQGD